MNGEMLGWVIAALILVVLALVTGVIIISNKAVNTSGEQYPAATMDRLESLIKIVYAGAKLTKPTFDEEGVKLWAELQGFTVEIGTAGELILKRPPVVSPPAAAG